MQAAKRYENEKFALLQLFLQRFSSKSDFKADKCSILVAANNLTNKLNNNHFREFLTKYCKKYIPNMSLLKIRIFRFMLPKYIVKTL